ncbi:MAG: hypothetical protein OXG39_10010 [Chloroflexi bacterium]|nr:hypothetical protein [Chloroflexota bacterium]
MIVAGADQVVTGGRRLERALTARQCDQAARRGGPVIEAAAHDFG